MKNFGDRLLYAALAVVVFVTALRWAWETVLRPLAPILLLVALGGVVLRYLIQRRGYW